MRSTAFTALSRVRRASEPFVVRRDEESPGPSLGGQPWAFRHNPTSTIWRKWIVPWIRLPVESTRRREAGIKGDFRIFTCKHCGKGVRICRRCDRGQRYCSSACSRQARRSSARAAERRYRESEAGRRGNARRQREYYIRNQLRRKNLTHQGSIQSQTLHIMALERRNEALHKVVGISQQRHEPQETQTWPVARQQTTRCDFCLRNISNHEDTKANPC